MFKASSSSNFFETLKLNKLKIAILKAYLSLEGLFPLCSLFLLYISIYGGIHRNGATYFRVFFFSVTFILFYLLFISSKVYKKSTFY